MMNIHEIRAIANHGIGSEMTKALNEFLDINTELLEALEKADSVLAACNVDILANKYFALCDKAKGEA
jgi:hypothetical protein